MINCLCRAAVAATASMAIVGYDDIEYAAAAAVPLSSVAQPREQLGRSATESLFDEISEGGLHRHRQVLFEPELVRESSRKIG